MQDSKPSRSRGIGFVIVCIVVLGTGIYLNAGFNGKIADLQADLHERFKALSEETTGVKPEIQTNRGALTRLDDGLISLESRVKSVSALATQTHDMLFTTTQRTGGAGRHPQCSGRNQPRIATSDRHPARYYASTARAGVRVAPWPNRLRFTVSVISSWRAGGRFS